MQIEKKLKLNYEYRHISKHVLCRFYFVPANSYMDIEVETSICFRPPVTFLSSKWISIKIVHKNNSSSKFKKLVFVEIPTVKLTDSKTEK